MSALVSRLSEKKNAVVYFGTDDLGNSVVIVEQLSDGKILGNWTFDQYLAAVEYDENTAQLFFIGMDQSFKNEVLLELNIDTGELTTVQSFPPLGWIERGISTYCPNGHILFLVIRNSQNKYSIVRIDTQNKVILSNVLYQVEITDIVWDFSTATMYAWTGPGDFTHNLVTLDIQNGNVLSTISSVQPYVSHGGSAYDMTKKVVYTSMLNATTFRMVPSWITVDITSGTTMQMELEDGFPVSLVYTS